MVACRRAGGQHSCVGPDRGHLGVSKLASTVIPYFPFDISFALHPPDCDHLTLKFTQSKMSFVYSGQWSESDADRVSDNSEVSQITVS